MPYLILATLPILKVVSVNLQVCLSAQTEEGMGMNGGGGAKEGRNPANSPVRPRAHTCIHAHPSIHPSIGCHPCWTCERGTEKCGY
ncbi:hypothetical protein B0T24DRAFT_621379 [Lasiosphaeria ovina]|uniref:Secreted protein n=1 Tax=Lasiosphaeria ovina TaxID=92902 RepID=A0AAE0K9U8_9PEZI|nr:hypothetical protein B0T24DRAFT_621379 [Lasiosphaeria ovina]